MQKYVALLRGINFGGRKKVEMLKLKTLFESLKLSHVLTYINSGNVIFSTDYSDLSDLTLKIENEIIKNFGFEVKVLVINYENFNNIYQAIPVSWTDEVGMLPHIAFLWKEIDSPDILTGISISPEKDTVKYVPSAILWNVELKNWSKDTVYRFASGKISGHVTIRSMNTVRKLTELMK